MGTDAIKQLVGKRVRVYFDDGEKVLFKEGVISAVDSVTIMFTNGNGIAVKRYVRHEVVE